MSHDESGLQPGELERLTLQAVYAAERGDWDTVEACVERRGVLIQSRVLSRGARDRVLALDVRLIELAAQAKTAIGVLLMEAGQTRRKLQQLQQGHTGSDPGGSRLVTIRA